MSESPGVTRRAAEARQEKVIDEVVRNGLLLGDAQVFVEHIWKCFLSVLREGLRRLSSAEEHLRSFLAVTHHHIV